MSAAVHLTREQLEAGLEAIRLSMAGNTDGRPDDDAAWSGAGRSRGDSISHFSTLVTTSVEP